MERVLGFGSVKASEPLNDLVAFVATWAQGRIAGFCCLNDIKISLYGVGNAPQTDQIGRR
jgi:hypothetical protein